MFSLRAIAAPEFCRDDGNGKMILVVVVVAVGAAVSRLPRTGRPMSSVMRRTEKEIQAVEASSVGRHQPPLRLPRRQPSWSAVVGAPAFVWRRIEPATRSKSGVERIKLVCRVKY